MVLLPLVKDELRVDLVDSCCLVWFEAFKSGLDLLSGEVAREVEISTWGMVEVSHLGGDVSSESLSRILESPITDDISGDGICCYGLRRLTRPFSLLMVCHARRLEWVKSIDSTVSVHLSLRLLSSLAKSSVTADTLSALDVASV